MHPGSAYDTSLICKRFNIGSSGQQIHISFGTTDPSGTRHPCFKLPSREELEEIKTSIYEHHVRGGSAAPMAADKPGEIDSGKWLNVDIFVSHVGNSQHY